MAEAKKLLSYEEALAIVLANAPVLQDEAVALRDALGRVLRGEVVADRDQPPFDRSAMDGFAVRHGEVKWGKTFVVTGVVAAGSPPPPKSDVPDSVVRIATGAVVPDHFDAVIPIEQANVEMRDGGEVVSFDVDDVRPWVNIHRQGADAKRREVLVEAGTRLKPQHIGIAAAVGATALNVAEQPRITLLTTGDEVLPCDTRTDALQPQQIRNSNGPLLAAFFDALGTPILEHVHVVDEPERTLAAAREALSRSHLVITCGGVSVGQRDLLPRVWQQLGLTVLIHGVNIQPGKPLFVATPSAEGAPDNKLVIGLPGNPVSVWCTANLFVAPLVERMGKHQEEKRFEGWREVRLASEVKCNPRRALFRAAKLRHDGAAEVIAWHGSGDLAHTASMDGWVRLPITDAMLPKGESVMFLPSVG